MTSLHPSPSESRSNLSLIPSLSVSKTEFTPPSSSSKIPSLSSSKSSSFRIPSLSISRSISRSAIKYVTSWQANAGVVTTSLNLLPSIEPSISITLRVLVATPTYVELSVKSVQLTPSSVEICHFKTLVPKAS